MKHFAILSVLALAACNTVSTAPEPTAPKPAVTAAVAAECALLEKAYAATQAAGAKAFNDIVLECPGREGLRTQMNRFDGSGAFLAASRAPVPAAAAGSDVAKNLFRRMIARGVPVEVATQMTGTAEFSRAVAALS